MKWICFLVHACLILLPIQINAQGIVKGRVTDGKNPVPFVNIGIEGLTAGTASDESGNYRLVVPNEGKVKLVFSAVGYRRAVKEIFLEKDIQLILNPVLQKGTEELDAVVVSGSMKESWLEDSPVKVEVITAKMLQVTPVTSVMEAIGMVNGVQEQISCGVCGTNDIHINGMEGPYTLILIDGMPIISALGSVYGLNGIPASIIDRIEIIKGPSSTLYGSEAVGGVINIITKNPGTINPAGLSSFYTSHHESSTDMHVALSPFKKTEMLLSANVFNNNYRFDDNNDGFTDIPVNRRISVFNKWNTGSLSKGLTVAGRIYTENRFGGQLAWREEDRGSSEVYGESIRTNRAEVTGNLRRILFGNSCRLEFSGSHHHQDSWYGDTPFEAQQQVLYNALILNRLMGKHDLTLGAALRYQKYTDNTPARVNDERMVPGIFIQDEFSSGKFTFLPGLRLDLHHDHGLISSPRLSIKTRVAEFTTLRLNSGTGFRQVNLFTEDHAALTGSRNVVVAEQLKPEQSVNVSLNLHHVTQGGNWTGNVDADIFYTRFSNKILPDYDTDPDLIIYRNLTGFSITRGASLSWFQQFSSPLKLRMGITFQDVYQVSESGESRQRERQQFVPVCSGTWTVSYSISQLRLFFDYTGTFYGPQLLPIHDGPDKSPWFSLQHLQTTYRKSGYEIFGGVKNLFNFTQPSPLISPHDPFGSEFDTSLVWGPLQPRRFFIGLRVNFGKK